MSALWLQISMLGGSTCELYADEFTTVGLAKQQIEVHWKIPSEEQRLLQGISELADDAVLSGLLGATHEVSQADRQLKLQMLRVPPRTLVWKTDCVPKGREFLVASYSVSSDLSDSGCPKRAHLLQEVMSEGLDFSCIRWATRQQKIIKELSRQMPDIVCIQGLKKATVPYCCLMPDELPEWHHADDHAMHLFHALSKHDYCMVFNQALRVPGEQDQWFGSAVLWRDSSFQLQKVRSRHGTCIAVLRSRHSEVELAVGSSKTTGSYARDWGTNAGEAEDLEARSVEIAFIEAMYAGALPIWCGDFGRHLPEFLVGPQALVPGGSWKEAGKEIFGDEQWTAISPSDGSKHCSDRILFDARLEACAALSPLRSGANLQEHLRAGHASEHVMQLAILRPSF